MVNRWIAVLVVLLLVVPVAVAADGDISGQWAVSESALNSFTQNTHFGGGAIYRTNDIGLTFKNIEYYKDITTLRMYTDNTNVYPPASLLGGAGATDVIAVCDGMTIGTGTISVVGVRGDLTITIVFDLWDIGSLSGRKNVVLDYAFGDDERLYTTLDTNQPPDAAMSPATGSWDVYMSVPSTGGYVWYNGGTGGLYDQYVWFDIHHTINWINQWENTELNDISNNIKISRNVAGQSYTSDIIIVTPLDTYDIGSGSSDFEVVTTGRPMYIYVTDIYSNEYLTIVHGDDYCSFSGTVYDVTDGSPLESATVVAKQNSIAVGQLTDTTDAAGAYEYIGVPLQTTTVLTTTKTGYTSQDLTFAPPWSQDWIFDLYMWPDDMSWNGSAIGGIAYTQGSSQGVAGATVHLWNATFSTNVTANSVGYYLVDNLTANSTYSVQASATDHTDSEISTAETAADTFTQTDVALQGIYSLDVSVRNSETGNLLDNSTVHLSLSDGQDATTTTGTYNFSVNWGTYTVTASADGYYSGSEYVAVDEDATVTVNLVQTSTSGAGAYYPPHNVRFHVQDEFGNPLPGLLITAVYEESSGPIEWLQELFGLPSSVEVENTTLSGTTGVDGSITFSMVEVVQYEVTASNSTAGISHTFLLYPKEDQYTIRFTLGENIDWSQYPDYEVMAYDINDTYVGLNFMYNDTLTSSTDSITFTVAYGNKTPLYSANVSDQTANVTYAVENIKGDSYFWGFTAEHAIYGTISSVQGITLKGGTGRIVDLGLSDDDAVWYIYLSMIVTGLIAGLFSITNVKMGVIMIPLSAGFFFFIGWLPAAMAGVIAAAFAFGVLIYMRKSEYKLRSGY